MDDQTITDALVSQYQAALAMFRNAVAAVPDARWDDAVDVNRTWLLACHALYFTHLYCSPSEERFEQWAPMVGRFDPHEDPFDAPAGTPAFTRDEVLAYADAIEAMLPTLVPVTPYDGPSGFSWLRIARFEHHVRNIRHLQHHAGQISERARAAGGDGLEWTGAGPNARTVTQS